MTMEMRSPSTAAQDLSLLRYIAPLVLREHISDSLQAQEELGQRMGDVYIAGMGMSMFARSRAIV